MGTGEGLVGVRSRLSCGVTYGSVSGGLRRWDTVQSSDWTAREGDGSFVHDDINWGLR
jgi:hypothetical protein